MMKLPSITPFWAQTCYGAFVFLFLLTTQAQAQSANWPQWGGPQRNFMVDANGLAETWPASGPKRLWSRPLGEGHSSIIVDADRLYTMYSKGEQEFVVALDRATGKTIWEKGYAAPTTGLWREYGGTRTERGYTCSPLVYQNRVIVIGGGVGQSLMSFDLKAGAVVWKKQSFRLSFSTPTLINVDGQDQLAMAFADDVVGLDPQQWRTALETPAPVRWVQHHTAAVGRGQNSIHLFGIRLRQPRAAIAAIRREDNGQGVMGQ